MKLESLGAGPSVFGAFQVYAAQGLILARVAMSHRDQYSLFTEEGEAAAEPAGALWYRSADAASMPVVGDWVAARMVGAAQAIVEAVLPRSTCFLRRAAGRREERQAIAANIDTVFLVCGLDGDFNLRRLERYLTLAAQGGAAPVVVLNKTDVCGDYAGRVEQVARVAGGAPVVALSALAANGVEPLRQFLGSGRTVALLGSSGGGKSTIINRLLGEERLRTGEVRTSDSRGRHTTTHRELIPLPGGGALIDTPGMRELQLWAGQGSVEDVFGEIVALAAACRFADCSHAGEPGCAVAEALMDGRIARERFESYRKLLAEANRHEELTDARAAQERKRKLKVMMRAQKRFYRGDARQRKSTARMP